MSDYIDKARILDEADALANVRQQFQLNPGEVYLDGNSLGALPLAVSERLSNTVKHEWGTRQIRSWNESWIDLPQQTAAKIAPLVGAQSQHVICADSVSVNLFKLIAASLHSTPERTTILSVKDMFPTDLYISQGIEKLLGHERCEVKLCEIDQLDSAVDQHTNVVVLSQVNFRTGEAYDLSKITHLIQAGGARVIWDISHSVGVLPIELELNNIDYAVGCGYKFLNGGPGAPAFAYVREDLQLDFYQPLSGWMGHKDPFAFVNEFEPATGIDRLLAGTPNILSLSALDSAMDVFQNLDLRQVFTKAQDLAAFFVDAIEQTSQLMSFTVVSPPARGAQVSLCHDQAFSISQALIAAGVICDFREPNIVRFGFSPLYTRFEDVATAVHRLTEIMDDERYTRPEFEQAGKVT